MNNFFNLPAPAKLNLFLHVVGRRKDGMHLLQSVFQLIDLYDLINLEELPSPEIKRVGDINWDIDKDLCFRAAKALQTYSPKKGVRITVEKRIPAGSGLGGGSSDAATVLIGLNRLWELNLSQSDLMKIGESLGSDVPFFIGGKNAFVEGIGEILKPIQTPKNQFIIAKPEIGLATRSVFCDPELTRNTPLCKIAISSKTGELQSSLGWFRNDLQPVAVKHCPELRKLLDTPMPEGKFQMTGSGTACFYRVKSGLSCTASGKVPQDWRQWLVRSLDSHPLLGWIQSRG